MVKMEMEQEKQKNQELKQQILKQKEMSQKQLKDAVIKRQHEFEKIITEQKGEIETLKQEIINEA